MAKSTTTDRHVKAEATRGDRFDNLYDVAHLEHKFEQLKSKPWLLKRLGEANTKRRNYFRYCRTHRDRLAESNSIDFKNVRAKAKDAMPANSTALSRAKASTMHSDPSNVQTKASTLGFVDMQAGENGFDDAASFSTMANSVTDDRRTYALSVPKLFDITEPGVDFECPYCFTIRNFNGQSGWR